MEPNPGGLPDAGRREGRPLWSDDPQVPVLTPLGGQEAASPDGLPLSATPGATTTSQHVDLPTDSAEEPRSLIQAFP